MLLLKPYAGDSLQQILTPYWTFLPAQPRSGSKSNGSLEVLNRVRIEYYVELQGRAHIRSSARNKPEATVSKATAAFEFHFQASVQR